MILQRTSDGVLAIKQPDHAAFAAFLLEHWSSHTFAHDEQREQIILATREHDNGWAAFEADPRIDPGTRLPVDFMGITPEESLEIWRRATARFLPDNPFVALLITHHAYSIHEITHKREAAWKDFFTEFARQRADLRNELGVDHPHVERAYSFLRMADWFSLAYCRDSRLGAEKPETYGGYMVRRDGGEFQFKPYPFDGRELHYQLPAYRLRSEGYADVADLLADLETPSTVAVTLVPMGRLR